MEVDPTIRNVRRKKILRLSEQVLSHSVVASGSTKRHVPVAARPGVDRDGCGGGQSDHSCMMRTAWQFINASLHSFRYMISKYFHSIYGIPPLPFRSTRRQLQ
jgi:hypothetical protein